MAFWYGSGTLETEKQNAQTQHTHFCHSRPTAINDDNMYEAAV